MNCSKNFLTLLLIFLIKSCGYIAQKTNKARTILTSFITISKPNLNYEIF